MPGSWRTIGLRNTTRKKGPDDRRRCGSVAVARQQLPWPAAIPIVWSPWLAFRTMVQVEGRALRREPITGGFRQALPSYKAAQQAAMARFPGMEWRAHKFQAACPLCGRFTERWLAGQRWWCCLLCSGQYKQHVGLSWVVADYLCAVKLGLTRQPLLWKRKQVLRAITRTQPRLSNLLVIAVAAQVLRYPACFWAPNGRRWPGTSAYGPLRDRLSVLHPDAVWDMQVCPEAFWARVVASTR